MTGTQEPGPPTQSEPGFSLQELGAGEARLRLSGDWSDGAEAPAVDSVMRDLDRVPGLERVALDTAAVDRWDSQLPAFCLRLDSLCRERGIALERQRQTPSLDELLDLAMATPPHSPLSQKREALSLAGLRRNLQEIGEQVQTSLALVGDTSIACLNSLRGRSDMRLSDLALFCRQAGPDALPIITLTSVLVGMILAYLGAVQLSDFGAELYVADLVTIGMLREMGALMTAVVMAGRTGAAYAAQLGTMRGNDEVDALVTLGLSPVGFLVAPRVLALALMMPLLTIYAMALGMFGGGIVAGGMGVTPLAYLNEMSTVLTLDHFLVGLSKSLLFALLIGMAGCRAGLSAERSSAGVGEATTNAVVTAVVYLIIADAGMNILFQQLDL
jgi:phospholipid/cholesterol/gamma-HCH transport system permease protein